MVVFLALASAFFIGLSNVLIRKGLGQESRAQAIVLSLVTSVVIFWFVLLLFGDVKALVSVAVIWLMAAGLLGPGLGRTLNIISLQRIGVARTIPVTGIAPFFATMVAILLLGEHFSLLAFLGMVSIVFGIFVLSKGRAEKKAFKKRDILLPLASAFFGGISIAIAKRGFEDFADPLGAAALAGTMALLVALSYAAWSGKARHLASSSLSEAKFSLLGGAALSAAFLLNVSALKLGQVSIVAPLLSTFPLFGVFLSHFLLKEQITKTMWAGVVLILAGVSFIQLL